MLFCAGFWPWSRKLFVLSFCLAGLAVPGCANEPEADAGIQAEAAVDPRYATAETLLAEYNAISTAAVVNPHAQLDLMYAENDFQRRMLSLMRSMIPTTELDRAMFDAFGEGWPPKSKKPMTSPEEAARMVAVEGQRARAEYLNSKGNPKIVQLVQIGDRWWVSGYTLEHDPESEMYRSKMADFERLMSVFNRFIPGVIADIKGGDIKSAQQARIQLVASSVAYDQSVGEILKKLMN